MVYHMIVMIQDLCQIYLMLCIVKIYNLFYNITGEDLDYHRYPTDSIFF